MKSPKSKKTTSSDKALLAHPSFQHALLEHLGAGGVLVLNNTGVIMYVSQRAERVLGISARKLEGQNYFDTVPFYNERGEKLLEKRRPGWQALHRKKFSQVTPFFCYYHKGNKSIPVAVQPVQVAAGANILGALIQVREATRKLNVDEMKTLFVSFAAHQLKTPSSIVKGFIELLLREGKKSYTAEQWDNLQSAYESNEHLIALSKTLLNVTRLEGGLIEPRLGPLNIRELVEAKIASRRLLLEIKRLVVDVSVSGDADFESDEVFFSEIVDIFLGNAIKHSPERGVIRVSCTIDNDGLRLAVGDEGRGINAEDRKKLFKQMAPDDPSHNSHGLGLFMAKKYLDLLGGEIGVRSETGKGSEFYFIVPPPLS